MSRELDFINMIGRLVVKYPGDFFNSVAIAQACLETGFGKGDRKTRDLDPYLDGNNAFGYKAKANEWKGEYLIVASPEEYKDAIRIVRSRFRKYLSVEESVKDHANMLSRSDWYANHYRNAIHAKTPEEQAMALVGTYATDSKYGEKLIDIINHYGLKAWDTVKEIKKGNDTVKVYPKPKIIDRRTKALGYPIAKTRRLQDIKKIGIHYTASVKEGYGEAIIKAHEGYWRGHHGWDRGGYVYFIDRLGNIFQNYDMESVTWGAKNSNPYTLHISCEASTANNYTPAQIKAREELLLWLLTGPLNHLGANDVKGHKEFAGNATACPGYTIAQLNDYRKSLSKKIDSNWEDLSQNSNNLSQNTSVFPKKSENGKYTVKHGDTLWAIAQANNVTVDELRDWNNITPGQWLKTGQVLQVAKPKSGQEYIVKAGDTLWGIANSFSVSVADIKAWNDLKSNIISIGQTLFISKPDKVDEPTKQEETPKEVEIVKEVKSDEKTPALEIKADEHIEVYSDGKVYVVKNK